MKWPIYFVLTALFCVVFRVQGLPLMPPGGDGGGNDAAFEMLPAATVESVTRTIEEEDAADPQAGPRTARLYMVRGSLWLQQHEPEKALADFDTALQHNPGEAGVRFGRAECYRQLGDLARADSEMRQAGLLEVDLGQVFPVLSVFQLWDGSGPNLFSDSPERACLVLAGAWLVLTVVNIAVGWASKVEGAGSLWRLLRVAGCLGIVQVLPLTVWVALVTWRSAGQIHVVLALGMTFFSFICTIPFLQPPIRLRGTNEKLPRVEDPAFLSRVVELARKMAVPVPLVRLWPSITGSQQALAFAGTLHAPQLVVTDGILRRLSAIERDAVVAHELGHITNGSLWFLAAVIPVSCAVATAATAFLPLAIAIPFGLALAVGLRRVISRPLELDCDLRAARAIGFRETAGALTKIHAVHSFGDTGLLPLLVYATATHPSRAVRLWTLESAAPAEDSLGLSLCARTIRRHRTASFMAFVVWLLTLTGTIFATAWAPPVAYLAAPLWIVGLAPLTIQALARWKQHSRIHQRMGHNSLRTAFIAVVVLAGLILMAFPDALMPLFELAGGPEDSPFFLLAPLILAAMGLAAGSWLKRNQETRRLRAAVAVAFQVHDFRRVLNLAASAPAEFARDHILQYNVALARAISGDRETAIAEFEQLCREKPHFYLGGLTLSLLLLDADRPGPALEIARAIVERLPRDAGARLLEARALRRLERLDEAEEACARALELARGAGLTKAAAAAVALDSGEFSRAKELIDMALELSPGDAYPLLVRAEICLQTEPFEDPRPAVNEALTAIRANPLVFLTADVTRLEAMQAEAYPDEALLEAAGTTA